MQVAAPLFMTLILAVFNNACIHILCRAGRIYGYSNLGANFLHKIRLLIEEGEVLFHGA